MDPLNARFGVLQEVLMAHFEQGSDKLSDQRKFWDLCRREHLMLYCARKRRMPHLGMTTVPSLATSEAKAKAAIKMGLLIGALMESPFATEPWTMSDTSLEMLEAPPTQCFKKHGVTVEVCFDNDPGNSFLYTLWGDIYYMDEDNKWRKSHGEVDYDGLSYMQHDGERVYYNRFLEDARNFGRTLMWTVIYKNKRISASVSSSTFSAGRSASALPEVYDGTDQPQWPAPRGDQSPASSTTDTSPSTSNRSLRASGHQGRRGRGQRGLKRGRSRSPQHSSTSWRGGLGRGRGRYSGPPQISPHTPTWGQAAYQGCTSESDSDFESTSGDRGRGIGGCGEEAAEHATDGTAAQGLEGGGPGHSPCSHLLRDSAGGGGLGGGGEHGVGGQQGERQPRGGGGNGSVSRLRGGRNRLRDKRHLGPPRISPGVSYSRVARRRGKAEDPAEWSAGRAGEEARREPVILFKGGGNGLKCWRKRLKEKHRSLFAVITTTFSYAGEAGSQRVGRPRMLVGFCSTGQRDLFLAKVKIPPTVDYSFGDFDAL